MPDTHATQDRAAIPWKTMAAIFVAGFGGESAAAHFASASAWFVAGWLIGGASIFALFVAEELGRTR